MRDRLKRLLVKILSWESAKILEKFKPEIIAITGNVGKTTTKDLIHFVLSAVMNDRVRASEKSQNSELGVPLAIIGAENPWGSVWGWFKVITFNFLNTYFGNWWKRSYPEILVLEIGADHPGDIAHLTSFIKPNMVVLTAFQKNPVHGEFFPSIQEHIREKKYLPEALVEGGRLIFNADDEVMSLMAEEVAKTKEIRLYRFGKKEGSEVQILESENCYSKDNVVEGTKIKLGLGEYLLEIKLPGVLGEAQNYSLAAAVLVGIVKGLRVETIKHQFAENKCRLTKSRMRILRGLNNSIIIDDSYNASPIAVENALETLRRTFAKGKKIVVLGHMAELGDRAREAHMQAGKLVGNVADLIIFSGNQNEHYLDGLRETKFNLNKVFLATSPQEVNKIIFENNLLQENDLMLVKGSQSARLEKVVVNFLRNPEDKEEVCRQDKEWLDKN